MIGGIYTADPEKLSLRATLPRFLEMEHEHGSVIRAMWKQRRSQNRSSDPEASARAPGTTGKTDASSGVSGARYSLFLSFDRGMQVLADEVTARLAAEWVRVNTRVNSLALDQSTGQWQISLNDDSRLLADLVCLAVPAHTAALLLQHANPDLARALDKISYASTATVNLAFQRADVPHPLDGFGFVVPFIEKRSLLACTFSSVKFPGRAPQDQVLLRAFVGGALQPQLFELDQDEMLRRVLVDLRDLLGITKPPLFSLTEKWRRSMPQFHVGHLELLSQIRELTQRQSGLYLAGNAYGGAGVPDCIRSGESAAQQIFEVLRKTSQGPG